MKLFSFPLSLASADTEKWSEMLRGRLGYGGLRARAAL